jgi:hypothetical protein
MATAKLTKAQKSEIDLLINDFDNARSALFDKLDEIAGEWDDEISERSEKWQQSEASDAARERTEQLRQWGATVQKSPDFDMDGLTKTRSASGSIRIPEVRSSRHPGKAL